jgi:hypothetical protein
MVGLPVELDQFSFEVGAHRPHDLFHASQVGVAEHRMPVFRDENQVCVKQESAVTTSTNVAHLSHKPMVGSWGAASV